jgi:drug/metabolite transporter (DMT)-like permease
MHFLFLTILSSTTIALILKHNDTRNGNPIVLLAGNYFIAAFISAIYFFSSSQNSISLPTFFFGAFLGVLFVLAFFAFTKAVGIAGTALATVSSRLSVVVPVLLSMVLYTEIPSLWQIFGFVLALITIVLFYRSLKNHSSSKLKLLDFFYLVAVLVGIGINDFCMKLFQSLRPLAEKPFFLFTIFFFAFLYTIIYVRFNHIAIDKYTGLLGCILGIPNMFSSFFLLSALALLPGIIVYPVVNIGIILLTAFSAALIWNEKLNIQGKWALLFGIIAIILLVL